MVMSSITFVSPTLVTPHIFKHRKCTRPRFAIRAAASDSHSARTAQREERAAVRRSLSHLDIEPFHSKTASHLNGTRLSRRAGTTLQINIGLTCNLACRHCHVESSPSRRETMLRSVADRLLALTATSDTVRIVDITGGAPEMHREFRRLVEGFTAQGRSVIDRCNLVVLEEPGQEDLVDFLAQNRVKVIASLPCYTVHNVEKQRGDGVFDASIRALQALNKAGYGVEGSGLELDLVYNPIGPFLPPKQSDLEMDYRRELRRAFGIEFSKLLCIANMPIKRFADDLVRSGNMEDYMRLLLESFNPATLDSVMCRDMIHVSWDGSLHDCDFNYAMNMPLRAPSSAHDTPLKFPQGLTVFDIESWDELVGREIRTGLHCYGCTAGTGSSCGGALAS